MLIFYGVSKEKTRSLSIKKHGETDGRYKRCRLLRIKYVSVFSLPPSSQRSWMCNAHETTHPEALSKFTDPVIYLKLPEKGRFRHRISQTPDKKKKRYRSHGRKTSLAHAVVPSCSWDVWQAMTGSRRIRDGSNENDLHGGIPQWRAFIGAPIESHLLSRRFSWL